MACVAALVAATSMLGMAFAHEHRLDVVMAGALTGSGCSLLFACVANVTVRTVDAHSTGAASGLNATVRMVGGAAGTALVAGVLTAHASGAGVPAESGYVAGFASLGVAFLLAGCAALLVPDQSRP